jgi:hypothetical protein
MIQMSSFPSVSVRSAKAPDLAGLGVHPIKDEARVDVGKDRGRVEEIDAAFFERPFSLA